MVRIIAVGTYIGSFCPIVALQPGAPLELGGYNQLHSIEVGGQSVTLTQDNVHEYIGRSVLNYKDTRGIEEISVRNQKVTVSTNYRLYYVDFENKYGNGVGSMYLKADVTNNTYSIGSMFSESVSRSVIL